MRGGVPGSRRRRRWCTPDWRPCSRAKVRGVSQHSAGPTAPSRPRRVDGRKPVVRRDPRRHLNPGRSPASRSCKARRIARGRRRRVPSLRDRGVGLRTHAPAGACAVAAAGASTPVSRDAIRGARASRGAPTHGTRARPRRRLTACICAEGRREAPDTRGTRAGRGAGTGRRSLNRMRKGASRGRAIGGSSSRRGGPRSSLVGHGRELRWRPCAAQPSPPGIAPRALLPAVAPRLTSRRPGWHAPAA